MALRLLPSRVLWRGPPWGDKVRHRAVYCVDVDPVDASGAVVTRSYTNPSAATSLAFVVSHSVRLR